MYLDFAHDIRPRTKQNLRVRVNMWERLGMPDRACQITGATYDEFRRRCAVKGYAAPTIETCVNAINTLVRHLGPPAVVEGGRGILRTIPRRGRVLDRDVLPKPMPSLDDLSAVYRAADSAVFVSPEWHRRLLVLAYNTALRSGDLLRVDWQQHVRWDEQTIIFKASKTGKTHHLPISAALRRNLESWGDARKGLLLPPHPRRHWGFIEAVRHELKALAASAGVAPFTPQAIRRRAGTEFERAEPGAGGLILGHTLHTTTFESYIPALEKLKKAAAALPQPQAFLEDLP